MATAVSAMAIESVDARGGARGTTPRSEPARSGPVYAFLGFELDECLRELRARGETVALRRRPLELVLYLIRHRQRVVSKNEILDALWPGLAVSEAALASAMRDLRRALRDSGRRQSCIKTYHGFGYRFVAPVEVREAASPAAEPAELLAGATERAGVLPEGFSHRLLAFLRQELDDPATPVRSC